ncbi:MAG TPA: DinB family protein [Thermoanaerobaculia bacterium]|jgi:uncharacterized damage-inducible protein DinB
MRRAATPLSVDTLRHSILDAWTTSDRTTIFMVERIPDALWNVEVPGTPRKTVRMLAAHLHNSRRGWIRTLGGPHGLAVPEAVDRRRVTRAELVRALKSSGRAMANLLEFGLAQGGRIPPTPAYVWRNLPLDVGHVLAYFVAHEGHHRGQILLIARALGKPLSRETVNGLWGWTRFSKAGAKKRR